MNRVRIRTALIGSLFVIGLLASRDVYAYRMGKVEITPRVEIGEKYDDNITFLRHGKKHGFVTTPVAGLDVKYEDRSKSARLSGRILRDIFPEHHKYDSDAQNMRFDLSAELSKNDRLAINNVFNHAEDPASFEDAFGRTTGRYSHYINRFRSKYTRTIIKQLSVSAKYDNDIDSFTGTGLPSGLRDSHQNRVGFEADYSISSTTLIMALYDFAKRDFRGGRNAYAHTITGGLRQYLTKQLYLDGRLGADLISSYDKKKHAKPLIFASITGEVDRNTRVVLSFSKRAYSIAFVEDFFNHWQLSGTLRKQLLEKLSVSARGFYGRGEYLKIDSTQKFLGATGILEYDISDKMGCVLSYTYSTSDPSQAIQGYKKNVVSLALKVSF